MASLSLNSAGTTSASINYDGGTGWLIPPDGEESSISWGNWGPGELEQERTGKSTQTSYSTANGCTTTWTWTFSGCTGSASDKSGITTVNDLDIGKANSISGTLSAKRSSKTVTRTYKQKHTRTKKDDGSYTAWVLQPKSLVNTSTSSGSSKDLGSKTTNTLTIYTKPSGFTWNIPSNGRIHNYISADKWNDLCDQAGKYLSWKNQQNKYNSASGAKTSSGQLIYASTYNALSGLLGGSTVYSKITLIKASHFTNLVSKVNGS